MLYRAKIEAYSRRHVGLGSTSLLLSLPTEPSHGRVAAEAPKLLK